MKGLRPFVAHIAQNMTSFKLTPEGKKISLAGSFFNFMGKALGTRNPGGGFSLICATPSDRVGFLRRFGLKTSIHFAHS